MLFEKLEKCKHCSKKIRVDAIICPYCGYYKDDTKNTKEHLDNAEKLIKEIKGK